MAVEELPKHKDFNGFSSSEKTKAEAALRSAFEKAEALKERLKESFERDAVKAKKAIEQKKAEVRLLFKKCISFPTFLIFIGLFLRANFWSHCLADWN